MKYSSSLYRILKPFIHLCLRIFFRRIEVDGLENVPQNTPILFTPNHQSAFMDAIVVACTISQPVHSVTRAGVFQSPSVAWLLQKLNMMPIYRIRNGIQNLAKNEATFDHCVELLQHQQTVLIFPEGSQNVVKRVRPLSKGFSRIVFRAEESKDFDLGLQIIPVGINYSQVTQFRGDLYLRYGTPLTIKDLKEIYREQPQQAMTQLRKQLQEHLEQEVVHINNITFYDTFEFISTHFADSFATNTLEKQDSITNENTSLAKLFLLQKNALQQLTNFAEQRTNEMQILAEKVTSYRQLLQQLQLKPETFAENTEPTFAEKVKTTLLAPIGIYGYINHFLPCKITQYLTYKMFKDPSFYASMKLGFGLLFILIFYFLQILLIGIFTQSAASAGLYLISLIISGNIALWIQEPLEKWRLQWKTNAVQKNKPLEWKQLETLRNQIESLIKQ
ncbi:MAG: lysophospholipid acyltransferase family protein [Chitinophagales bacterium]